MSPTSTKATNWIWINAGEASGDMHGALLCKALARLDPQARFTGMGGPALAEAGFKAEFSTSELSIMGFTEVFSRLPHIFGLLGRIKKMLLKRRPKAVILIDAPDFNFFVARMAHKLRIPVFYYISPQVWAWRTGRVKFLKKYMRRVLCILPFEKQFYAEHGMEVDFIGHPLLDQIPLPELDALPVRPQQVGMLPGSRRKEINSLLPEFVQAAKLLLERRPELCFTVAQAPGVDEETLRAHLPSEMPFTVAPPEDRYRLMRESTLLMAASGTATLEAALIGTPTIVTYKLSAMTYRLGRLIIDVPFISLPNLVMNEQVFPELIQEKANGQEIAAKAITWLDNETEAGQVRDRLSRLRNMMGAPGAPDRAAQIILDLLRSPAR
jgi:lipid-A-disaccharide synthase